MNDNFINVPDLNQSNLMDFKDCPRRFQFKHIMERKWPAAIAFPLESLEQSLNLGNKFHQIAHQYFLGLSPNLIRESISDPILQMMFDEFHEYAHQFLSDHFFAEQLLQISFGEFRLSAKFDLLVHHNGRFIILDWKTSKKKPPLSKVMDQMQTSLYPYIFTKAGQQLYSGHNITPDQIDLIYWYPSIQEHEVVIPYTSKKEIEFEQELDSILSHLTNLISSEEAFPLTRDTKQCEYCPFRSYCERDPIIGILDELIEIEQEKGNDIFFDLDQIIEIDF